MLVPVEAVAGKGSGVASVAVTDGQMQGHHGIAATRVRESMGERLSGFGNVRMLVPVETVASESSSVAGIAVSDGQVQGHHTVAARSVREGVGERLSGFGDVRMLVPVEAVAGEGSGVASITVPDGQMQGHHGVAAEHVSEGVGERLSGFGDVRILVPVEAIAGEGDGVARAGRQNRQMQRHRAVTAVDVGEMLDIVARFIVGRGVPGVAHAGGIVVGRRIFGVDVQVEGYDAVAAVDGRQCVHVRARNTDGLAVEVIAAAEADVSVDGAGEVRPHGQRHRCRAVAAIDVGVVVDEGISARLGEQRVEAVGLVADSGTDAITEGDCAGRVHGDVQHDGAVAAIDGGDDPREGSVADHRGRHVEAVEAVGLALAERRVQVGGVQLVDDEVQHRDRRTAVRVGVVVFVVARGRSTVDVKAVLRVVAAVADVRLDGVARLLTDGQRERHDAVAAVNRLQLGGIDTGLGERLPVEDEAAVLTDHPGDALLIDGTHGQPQLGDAVAAIDILAVVEQRVGAGLREERVKAVVVVAHTRTNLPVEHYVMRRVHRHDEVHRAVAAIDGLQVLRVSLRFRRRELESVAIVTFAEAEGYGNVGRGGLVDGEVQHGGAVTTVHIAVHMAVVLGLSRFRDVEVILVVGLSVADVRADFAAFLRTHIQMEVEDAVAAVHTRQGGGVIARGSQCLPVEIVLPIEADRILDFSFEHGIDGQGERRETVAAIDVLAVFGERIFAGRRKRRVEAVARVVGLLASLVGKFRQTERIDGHVKSHGAVTAVDSLQILRVGETADLSSRHVEAVVGVGVAVAKGCVEDGLGGLVNGQVQRGDAVAAVGVSIGMRVILRGSSLRDAEAIAVVRFAVADLRVEVRCLLGIMGQVQNHHTVTAVGGGEVGGVVTLLIHRSAVEQIAVFSADGLLKLRLEDGHHGEVEDGGAVAAVDGLAAVGQLVVAWDVVLRLKTVVVVGTAGADFVIQVHGGGLVDGQVHRHGTVTAVRRREALLVGSARGVGVAGPLVAHARFDVHAGMIGGLDGQVQRHRAVAAVGRREGDAVVPALGVGLAVPLVSVAGGDVQVRVLGGFDGQVQRHDTVTAVSRREGLRVTVGFSVGLAIPDVRAAGFV